ncbi:MAG: RsmE family RNA methyltransferase [Tepidisphaeraceae bacterium]
MRRILVPQAHLGRIDLPPAQAHHLRDVLRMSEGAELEIFDSAGASGRGRIVSIAPGSVSIQIEQVDPPRAQRPPLAVAAAVPKAARADWMIEKLSELCVDRFIPLAAQRSVVLPRGQAKVQRWRRLAEESARQSGRRYVMRIDPLAEPRTVLDQARSENMTAWYLSPADDAVPIFQLAGDMPSGLVLLVGPEGGWSPAEIEAFAAARIVAARITQTILRVETAAVAAAAVVQSALTLGPPAATILPDASRKSS